MHNFAGSIPWDKKSLPGQIWAHKFNMDITFCLHEGMELAKICIREMVYCTDRCCPTHQTNLTLKVFCFPKDFPQLEVGNKIGAEIDRAQYHIQGNFPR